MKSTRMVSLQVYLILIIISKEDDSCGTVAGCHFGGRQSSFWIPPFPGALSWAVLLLWFLGDADRVCSVVSTCFVLGSA